MTALTERAKRSPAGRIRELEGQVRYLTDHDPLTGLLNRRSFEKELTRQVARRDRTGRGGALLMIDLDGFKGINDHLGHAVGHELLRSLSASLQEHTRATDVLARLSGDEFAVLLPDTGRSEAEHVATHVLSLIRNHRSGVASDCVRVTASVGVALFDRLTEAEMLALADAAMHAAKDATVSSSSTPPTRSRRNRAALAKRAACIAPSPSSASSCTASPC